MKPVKKALIAAAGLATRFFPVTKTVPKQLIPLIDKPVIQYVVEEIAAAGVTDIIIVAGKNGQLFSEYFTDDENINSWLLKREKVSLVAEAKALSALARITVIEQEPTGNGAPILAAQALLGEDPFIFAFGDDVVNAKVSFTKQLLNEYEKHGKPVLGVQRVAREEVSKYGITRVNSADMRIIDIVEKPVSTEAQTELAEFGRMILDVNIVNELKQTPPGKGGELWIVDALERYISEGGIIYALEVKDGAWFTTGDPLNLLKATLAYALDRPDLSENLKAYLRTLQSR